MAEPKVVSVVNPNGDTVGLPEDELEAALANGYRVESPEELTSRAEREAFEDRPIAAGAAGVARGASFGLSDPLLEKTGLVDKGTLGKLQKFNPGASIAGELVGAVAPAFIPGGQFAAAGAAAKAGLAAERLAAGAGTSVARKIAGSAAAGALEGSLYGTGQLVTEELLGDSKVTGQKAAAALTLSTLLGGAGGAAAKALGLGASRALRRGASVADDAARAADDVLPGNLADDAVPGTSPGAVAEDVASELGQDAVPGVEGAAAGEASQAFPGFGPIDDTIGARAKNVLEDAVEDRVGTVKKVLEELDLDFPTAEKWVLRDLDVKSGQIAKLRDKKLDVSAPRALLEDARYAKVRTLEEKVELIRTKKDEAGRAIGDSVKRADEVAQLDELFDPKNVEAQLQGFISELEKGPAGNDTVVARLKKELNKLAGRVDDVADSSMPIPTSASPDEKVFTRKDYSDMERGALSGVPDAVEEVAEDVAGAVEEIGDVTPNMAGKLSFADAERFKRGLDNFISWDSLEPKPVQDALRRLRGTINGEIEAGVERVSKRAGLDEDVLLPWKKSKALYGQMRQLEKAAAPRLAAREGNRFFSLTDNMAGGVGAAIGGFSPLGIALGAGGAVLNKWARERLPQLVALKLYKMRGTPGATSASKGFEGFFRKLAAAADDAPPVPPAAKVASAAADVASTVPVAAPVATATSAVAGAASVASGGAGAASSALAPYMGILTGAAAKGSNVLFATHASLSEADPRYRHAMTQAGLQYEGSDSRRASDMDALEKKLEKQSRRVDKALDAFLSSDAKPTPRGLGALERLRIGPNGQASKGRTEAAKARALELAELAANPEALMERLADTTWGIGDAAPGANAELLATAQRAVAFLHEKAPKQPASPLDVPALRRPWTPSDADVSRFERYAAAVDDPYAVTEGMAGGYVTRESVEALQAVYPDLYEETKNTILERLATHGSALSYSKRLTLGLMLGAPTDESLRPERIAALQAAHVQPEQQAPGGGGGGGGKSFIAASFQTDTERLASRRG